MILKGRLNSYEDKSVKKKTKYQGLKMKKKTFIFC